MSDDAMASCVALLLATVSLLYIKKHVETDLCVKWSRILAVIGSFLFVGAIGISCLVLLPFSLFSALNAGVAFLRLALLAVLFGAFCLIIGAQDPQKGSRLSRMIRKLLQPADGAEQMGTVSHLDNRHLKKKPVNNQ